MKESMWIKMAKIAGIELLIVCAVLTIASTGIEPNSTYPATMYVTEISGELDIVTLEDFSGNLWEFYGVEDWAIGDICSCIMDDNGTKAIEDDEIIDIKYSGNIGGN